MSEGPQERNANVVLTADVDAYNRSLKQASQETTGLSAQVDTLARSLDNLAKSAGTKLQIFGAGTAAGIAGVTAAYASFEKQMSNLQAQAAVTNRSFSQMENSVQQLRREFPVSTQAAADLVRQLNGLKDGTAQVNSLAETFTRLGAATGESTGALTQGLLGLQRQMGTAQKDTAKYANVLTELSQKNGVAAQSILDFSSAIAPIGRVAGMTQTEIMGVSTAFTKAGQDGYAAGNAFNKMLTDIMQATQSGSPDLAKYANLIGVTVDQFAKMDKTTAITDVFNELNRLGPNAIQILNRMGLDGMRTMRAITGVTQQTGGIAKQIQEARAAYGDQGPDNALGRGSQAATGGLADALVRLKNTSKEVGEGLGQNFAPVVTKFVDGITAMTAAAAKLVDGPLGTLASLLASIASAGALVGGTLLKFAGPLATIATGYALTRNAFTGGIMDRVRGRTNSPYQQAQAAGEMGPVRNAMYNAGSFLGGGANNLRQRIPFGLGGSPGGPGIMSRIAGVPLHAAAAGLNFLQMGYDPLHHPFDPTKRDEFLQAGSVSGAFNAFTAGRGGALAGGVSQMGSARQGMSAAWQQMMGSGTSNQAGQNVTRAFGGLGSGATALTRSFIGFNAGLARASAGLAVLATRATASVAGNALRGAGRGLMNFAGGPLGLGLMAGTGIMALRSYTNDQTSLKGVVGQGADSTGFLDTYRMAVGSATTAVYDFTKAMQDATKQSTPSTAEGAKYVMQSDVGTAMAKEYTNPAIGKMDEGGIKNLLRSSMTGKESPDAIQAIKFDLLKRFGGDTQKVQGILNDVTSGSNNFDFATYLTEAAKSNPGGIKGAFSTSDTSKTYYSQLGAEVQNRAARAGNAGGPQAFSEQTLADFNSLLKGAGQSYGSLTSAGIKQQNDFFSQMFLGGKGTVENVARNAQGGSQDDMIKVWKDFLAKDGDAGKAFDDFLSRAGVSRDQVERVLNGETVNGLTRDQLLNSSATNLSALDANVMTGPEMTQKRIAATRAGGAVQNLAEVQTAVQSTGDVNAQLQAVDAMVSKLQGMGMSASDIQGELINMKAAIGDTTDPLYQLATAAQGAAKDFNAFQMAISGKGVGTQYAQQGATFESIMGASTGPEGEQERKQALADIRQQTIEGANFFKQQLINQREFTISRQQAQADFQTQRDRGERDYERSQSRQAYDFSLQEQRGEEDYHQSRMRNQEDYNTSRERSQESYDIGIKRTLEDYQTSRMRGEQDYQLSLKRNAAAFSLAQSQSYQDYKTSRLRGEQDFNHQVEMMVQESAKQMMNIYERVTVQRTWSAASLLQNAKDQNQRMSEQAQNLDKARQMGLSSDTIKQLGLTDANNAQQLARLVADMASDPTMVTQFNKAVADRLKDASSLVKDQDNTAWEEMNRQYNLSLQRGQEDFNKSRDRATKAYKLQLSQQSQDYRTALNRGQEDLSKMIKRGQQDYSRAMTQGAEDYQKAMNRAAEDYNKTIQRSEADYNRTIQRQQDDYNIATTDMVTDFNKQMTRSQQQFDRMSADLTMSMEEVLTAATKQLTGNLKTEAELMLATWKQIKKDVLTVSGELKTAIDKQWGFLPDGRKGSRSSGSGVGGGHEAAGSGGGDGAPVAPVKDTKPMVPIVGGHIGTPFGKKGPMWASGYHTGDDYPTPTGTPIHAALAGKVMSTGYNGSYGNLTKIAVGPGIETWYAHQSAFGVKPGQRVAEGQVIGKSGATGNVTGPHLHFEVRENGKPVNPSILGKMVSSGATTGVTLEEQYAFEQLINSDPTLKLFFGGGKISDYLNSWANGRMDQLGVGATPGAPGGSGKPAPTNVTGNKAIVQRMSAARGWGQYWDSLYSLLMGESGFNNNAQNPSSSAYGIFQFLNGTWAGVGGHKTSDPTLQTQYGLEYIARSYGNPGNAYAKWKARSPHWYGDGAMFAGPNVIGVGERGPEAVIPLNEKGVDFMITLMSKITPGLDAKKGNVRGGSVPIVHQNTYTKVDSSTNYHGAITVEAKDPAEFAAKMAAKNRRKALTNPAIGGNR